VITMPSDQLLPPDCRRDASPRPTQLSTVQHRARAEPWTVQHLCTRDSTPRHAFGMFPKPGVAGSIPAGGTTSCLQMCIVSLWLRAGCLPNRQNCRHSADEAERHS